MPESLGNLDYLTAIVFNSYCQLGKGNLLQFLGVSVRERFFVKFVEQMSYFVGEYDRKSISLPTINLLLLMMLVMIFRIAAVNLCERRLRFIGFPEYNHLDTWQ